MGTPRRWSESAIRTEAKLHNTRTSFKQAASGAVKAAIELGIYEAVCTHMQTARKWTKAALIDEALKYNTRTEFAKVSPSAYGTAITTGILDDICSHMRTAVHMTKEEALAIALKYERPNDLKKADARAYNLIVRLNIREEAFIHMGGKFIAWTPKLLLEEASKYSSITEFRVANSYACKLATRKNLLTDFYIKAITVNPFNIKLAISGVYILMRNNIIVYVGKSLACIRGRVNSHLLTKKFDTVKVFTFNNDADIDIAELFLIGVNTPEYNKASKYLTKTTLKLANLEEVISSQSMYTMTEQQDA